jgi:hypothetical protein
VRQPSVEGAGGIKLRRESSVVNTAEQILEGFEQGNFEAGVDLQGRELTARDRCGESRNPADR